MKSSSCLAPSAKVPRYRRSNPQPLNAIEIKDALLTLAVVSGATGLSGSTIYRRMATQEFPAQVRLGARCSRWRAAEVRAWLAAQGSGGGTNGQPEVLK